MTAADVAAADVLDFWFLPPGHFQHGHYRLEWMRATPGFEEALRERFAAAVATAVAECGAKGPADMGKLMGLLKPRLAGKADMAEVSRQVKAALAG